MHRTSTNSRPHPLPCFWPAPHPGRGMPDCPASLDHESFSDQPPPSPRMTFNSGASKLIRGHAFMFLLPPSAGTVKRRDCRYIGGCTPGRCLMGVKLQKNARVCCVSAARLIVFVFPRCVLVTATCCIFFLMPGRRLCGARFVDLSTHYEKSVTYRYRGNKHHPTGPYNCVADLRSCSGLTRTDGVAGQRSGPPKQ